VGELATVAQAAKVSLPLVAAIDPKEALALLKQAVAAFPELGDEILGFIGEEYTAAKAAALFDYIFVIANTEASRTDHPVVGYRLRNADERLLARAAFELKK
jgi:hypothetical protein